MSNRKHGMEGTKFYRVWVGLKKRCDTKTDTSYKYYGGRGISYDPKWKSFVAFYKDMFPTYSPGLSIDRIDNYKNYSKKNCRWISMLDQQKNKRPKM